MFASKKAEHKYIDRGDPSSADFAVGDLTEDGSYHDLDLSVIIPKTAKLVLLRIEIKIVEGGINGIFRKKGNCNELNAEKFFTLIGGYPRFFTFKLSCNSEGVIEYKVDSGYWIIFNITVGGWWI